MPKYQSDNLAVPIFNSTLIPLVVYHIWSLTNKKNKIIDIYLFFPNWWLFSLFFCRWSGAKVNWNGSLPFVWHCITGGHWEPARWIFWVFVGQHSQWCHTVLLWIWCSCKIALEHASEVDSKWGYNIIYKELLALHWIWCSCKITV